MQISTQARRTIRIGAFAIGSLLIAGCATIAQEQVGKLRGADELKQPPGIGPGANDLKRSPCACIAVPLLMPIPQSNT